MRQEIERGRGVAGSEFTRVHGGVGFAYELEGGAQCFGGVEVVVHGRVEALRGRTGLLEQNLARALGEALFLQPPFVIPQPFERGRGREQAVEGEIQLLR